MSEPAAPYNMRLSPQEIEHRLAQISLVVFDVDGTLTDGRIGYVGTERALLFHTHDGHGIRSLIETGAAMVAWCTTNRTMSIRDRARALKVTYLMQNVEDEHGVVNKKAAIEAATNIPWERIAYMGDDLIDVPSMRLAAVAAAPADARPEALMVADWVSLKGGGRGAARDFCDLILQAKGFAPYVDQAGMCTWQAAPVKK